MAAPNVTAGVCFTRPPLPPGLTYTDGSDVAAAVAAAAAADIAVVVGATSSMEGVDRADLSLGNDTNALIAAVCGAARASVAVLVVPGAVLTRPWSDVCGAVLVMIMPGQVRGRWAGPRSAWGRLCGSACACRAEHADMCVWLCVMCLCVASFWVCEFLVCGCTRVCLCDEHTRPARPLVASAFARSYCVFVCLRRRRVTRSLTCCSVT